MRLKAIVILFLSAQSLLAQIAEGAFHVTWTTLKPTYTDFVSKTSSRGVRIGYTKFINEKFGVGLEGGYSVLDDYVPLQTYEIPGGAFTTDVYNYMYYYSLTANGHYYFKTSELFMPYAGLIMGAGFTDYTIFYNVYSDSDTNASFLVRPEIGMMYRFSRYSGFGLKAAIGFDYATNKSKQFELNNFSGVSLQIGIVLISH